MPKGHWSYRSNGIGYKGTVMSETTYESRFTYGGKVGTTLTRLATGETVYLQPGDDEAAFWEEIEALDSVDPPLSFEEYDRRLDEVIEPYF